MTRPKLQLANSFGIGPIFRLMALQWWRMAREHLTRRNPLHADIPEIVLKVHALENAP